MATVNDFLNLTNCKIKFTTYEGDYEGVVRLVSPVNGRLIIDRIFFLPDRIYMGTLYFFCNEITDLVVLSQSETVKEIDSRAHHRKCESRDAHSVNVFDEFDDSDAVSVGTCLEKEFPEDDYVLKLPPNFDNLPLDVVTLESIGEDFQQAIKHLKSEASIGISLEGPKLGRHGIISWLCASTSCCTFVFDIQELGKEVFEKGLREILENSSIQKIIHDCREVSDCLFHMFNTRLVNVFDTQVADKLVTMQKSHDSNISKHVDSLNSCLRNYLEVPEEFLYRPKPLESYHHRVASFQLRPPPWELQDLMVKNVIYLRTLKVKLEYELLNPFRRAVDVYLQVLQCATDRELLLDPSVPDQFPYELLLDGIQIVRFKNYVEIPSVVASGPPYRETKNPIKQFLKHCKTHTNFHRNTSSDNFSDTDSKVAFVACPTFEPKEFKISKGVPVANELSKVCQKEKHEDGRDFKPDDSISHSSDNGMNGPTIKSNCLPVIENSEISKVEINTSPDYSCTTFEPKEYDISKGVPTGNELSKVCQKEKHEFGKDFKPDNSGSHSSDNEMNCPAIKSNCLPVKENSKISKVEINRNPDYSRRQLDKMFSLACSNIEDEDSVNPIIRNMRSSESDEPDDPWGRLRAEFSNFYNPIENDQRFKRRLVPAGNVS